MANPSQVRSEMKTTAWLALAMLSALPGVTGCGRDGLPTYPVTGKVVFPNGRPLEGGTIVFESVDHPVAARSVIDMDGSFRLGTYEKGDGAVAGLHRVGITPADPMEIDRDERRPPRVIHPKYKDIDESGLEFEVQAKGPNEFEIEVSRR